MALCSEWACIDVLPSILRIVGVAQFVLILAPRAEALSPQYAVFPRFDATNFFHANASRYFFEEHGFAVFKGASPEEVSRGWELFWEYLEGLGTGIDRRRPATWEPVRWPSGHAEIGLMVFFGIGQSDFMWHIRGLPRVRAAFEAIWGVKDLLASFDGSVVFRSKDDTQHTSTEYWWHVDQNPRTTPNFNCVQGLVQLTEASPKRGGFVLIPDSHKLFPKVYEDRYSDLLGHIQPHMNFFSLPRWDPLAINAFSARAMQPHLEAGDLIIWDSRTLHCSFLGDDFAPHESGRRAADEPERPSRVAALITMTPRDWATPEVLQLRKEAVCKGVTTTHWPHTYVDSLKHNIERWLQLPEDFRSSFRQTIGPSLNVDQLRLVGYTEEHIARLGLNDGERFHCDL
eukprot:TRINITY_DN3527_c0_g2_i1.p1 TRINITY_DN3527_c0_g2~~TRINITY_DN3527_c0_g2_i1.p1  ORF type:complete len:415 (-),score=43.21 TRINITY_DN3527_c0_g2_i1:301-1500(-)